MSNISSRNGWLRVFTVVMAVFLVSTLAIAQGIVTGSMTGTVVDEQSAVIAGAQVKAVQNGTNQEFKSVSDAKGFFQLRSLPTGTYTVTISAPNFTTRKVNDVVIQTGVEYVMGNAALKIGSNTEVVNVEATAPLVETSSSQVSTSFDTKDVQKLPNGGAGFDNLALYIPGVANNGSVNFSNTNGAAFSSNGLRGRSNNFQIDGQSNNDNSIGGPSIFLSNPDVLGEVQVVTNNFSAEYGRDSGSVVNYVTKQGTNAFHGSGFEYYTGSLFNTRTNGQKNPLLGFCTDAQVIDPTAAKGVGNCNVSKVPRSDENRFGGTIGGPIWRDHAWFFGSYQGDRFRSGASPTTTTLLTPTPNGISQLAAAFGANNPAVKALQTVGPYAVTTGNPTPTTTSIFNVTANGVTAPIEFAGLTRFVPSLSNDRQITGRSDMNFSDKDRVFVRYIYQQTINTVASGTVSSGSWVDVPAKDQQIGLDYTRTWNSHWVSQARFSYSRAGFGFEGGAFPTCLQASISNCPASIAINNTDPANKFASFAGNRSFGIANNLPQGRLINNTQYVSNNTWAHGRHTVKFGGEFDRQRSPNVFLPNINGTFTFNSFDDFIAGTGSTLTLAAGPKNFNFKEKDLSFYAQDDFRWRDNVTLNLGLRWEWNQQAVNLLSDITVANQAATPPFWSTAVPTNVTELPQVPQALKNFGPNIGFAYTPRFWQSIMGQDKTVIRGGYRIAYDPSYYNIFLNVATAAPVVNLGSISNVGLPASGATGADVDAAYLPLLPTGVNPGTRNQTRVTPDFHQPMTQEWSLGIERQIGAHVGVESRYVGNHVTGNFQTIDGNPQINGLPASVIPSGVTACSTAGTPGATDGRADCNFNLVRVRNNGAWSIYHGLQNRVDVHNLHGMTAGVAYTWSKALDNVSDIFASSGGISTPVAQDPFDPNLGERAVSADSFPHVFTTFWIYQTPWFKNQSGIMGHILGGWQWTGQYQWQSGAPITPDQEVQSTPGCDANFANAFIGVDSCRPIASNLSLPFDQVGVYGCPQTNATTKACGTPGPNFNPAIATFTNVSTGAATTPAQVALVVNNALADATLCGGNPFACTLSRNTYRAQNRNNLNLGLEKSVKLNERFNLQLRADMFNVFNRQFFGTPGLDINTSNLAAGGTLGTYLKNGGTNRSMILLARISF